MRKTSERRWRAARMRGTGRGKHAGLSDLRMRKTSERRWRAGKTSARRWRAARMRGPGRGKHAGLSDLRLAALEQVSQALREYLRKMATERARLGRWSPAPARRSRPQTPTKGTASAGPGDRKSPATYDDAFHEGSLDSLKACALTLLNLQLDDLARQKQQLTMQALAVEFAEDFAALEDELRPMVLRAPAGGGQAVGTAGASWHGQIFVRLNQDGGAQTVTREGGLTLRMGATRVLEVSSEDTVAMVKERVPGAERLVFGGKDLPDHATLAECGVPRDSTIDALPRCRGGAPTAADLATVRRELDLMRHLSQEMGARVARLQVCFVFAFPQLHQDLDCINPQT